MKILSNEQVRMADAFTIENEPIPSIDLMERAANQLYHQWICHFKINQPVMIFAGPGNNGGDGLALARLLVEKGFFVDLFILKTNKGLSKDSEINFKRLPENERINVLWLDESNDPLPLIEKNAIIVDALFGSGLKRPLQGLPARIVDYINSQSNIKVAIDIPSGLFAEHNSDLNSKSIVKANYTWCFQFPKLAFFMPENEEFVGEWEYLDIGLHQDFVGQIETQNYYTDREAARLLIKSRHRFSHKGNYGHALLIAGSVGKFGAAILSSAACMRSGVGLLTAHVPKSAMNLMHTSIPEAMLSLDLNDYFVSQLPLLEKYTAVGAGPGLGGERETELLIEKLSGSQLPMVLDADALNIVANNKDLLDKLPEGTIITPHPGEYIRLFGNDKDHFSRLERMRDLAEKYSIVIVLKGANTAIASPDRKLFFNSSGNPGMATAGSGDVLTGIILSLLAQGYESINAAVLAVYLHGLAGDIAVQEKEVEGLIAGDIIERLPDAFKYCKKGKK